MTTSRQHTVAVIAAMSVALLCATARAQRPEQSGKEVVDTVCAACHAKGLNGAPRIGDQQAWAPRAAQGLTALTQHALAGIRNMPAHGGNPGLRDSEIERAITYMVNNSGGRWVEPLGAQARQSERIVQTQCAKCHKDGLHGAPKIGDRAAWVPRMSKGLDALVKSAIHGRGAMPSRGGMADLSDDELRDAAMYMFNYGLGTAPSASTKATEPANPNRQVVDGMVVNLGVVASDAISAGQVPGKVPSGKGNYYVNVSVLDAKTQLAVSDARVKVQVADPTSVETKTMDIISANSMVSYGNYFRMDGMFPYTITARIQRQGKETMATFEYKAR